MKQFNILNSRNEIINTIPADTREIALGKCNSRFGALAKYLRVVAADADERAKSRRTTFTVGKR
jgi:hypothetical protein